MKKINVCLVVMAFLTLLLPVSSFAEWRVFILETMHVPVVEEHSRSIQKFLLEAVAETNQKIEIQSFNADGNLRSARYSLDKALSEFKPHLVISIATLATQVASRTLKGTDVPHLFCVVADPYGAGIVPEQGPDPDHQISGLIYGLDRQKVVDEAVRIIRAKNPQGPVRVGMLYSRYPSSVSDFNNLADEISKVPDVNVVSTSIYYQDSKEGMQNMLKEAAKLLQDLEDTVDYWWQLKGPLAEDPRFHTLFKNSKKPLLFGNNLQSVKDNAVFTISPDTTKTSRELVGMALQVLNGTPVSQFKINYAKDYVSAVNLKTARKYGLTIPPELLKLAGENVFQ